MGHDRKGSTHPHPEVLNIMKQIRSGDTTAGVHEIHVSDRDDLMAAVDTIEAVDADVSIMVNGLTAATLGVFAETICDLALETNAPLVFRHRGELLQLVRVEQWPPEP
jgi:hypothetical protein